MASTGDYVLGTHDAEIDRLELQHGVWGPAARAAWQRAGIAAGQAVIDIGCGPGFATRELAALVGPTGRVIAIDRSRRFLDLVAARGPAHVETAICDFDVDALPAATADAAWARWLFCFVQRPRELLARVAERLRPGGVFVAHEYFDYGAWRAAPREPALEDFVARVMASWRARGGEPDIALELPGWLAELGFTIASLRPIVEFAAPATPHWEWLARFTDVGLQRLRELGEVSQERSDQLAGELSRLALRTNVHIVTPAVLEIIAIRN